jgi:hypothetical protein
VTSRYQRWRRPTPETIAKRSLGRDLEGTIATPQARIDIVRVQRDVITAEIDRDTLRKTRPDESAIAELTPHIERDRARRSDEQAALAARREQDNAHSAPERLHAQAWRDAGLGWRLTCVQAPHWLHKLIIIGIALLDFKVFADAWAYVNRTESGAAHVLGGCVGLGVFVVGVMLAHGLSYLFLENAQRSLLADADAGLAHIDDDLRRRLVLARPVLGRVVLTALVFSLLVLLGMFVRISGTSPADRNLAGIAMQALIPLVGVAAEFWLTDPLNRRAKLPGRRERRLLRPGRREQHRIAARTRHEKSIDQLVVDAEAAKLEQTELFRHAELIIDLRQTDMGVIDLDRWNPRQLESGQSATSKTPGAGP